MKKTIRILASVLLTCLWLVLLTVLFLVGRVALSVRLDPERLASSDPPPVFLNAEGNPIVEEQTPSAVSLEAVPMSVRQAFLAAEDARFYRHHGLDLIRIAGAIRADLRAGSKVQGASTISQQLVKLTHLTPEKTWERKVKEASLALQLERAYSKDEILEMYLNTVYFGAGAYGIAAASETYFGCEPKDLSVVQGAALAGIVKSPSAYAPHVAPEACIQRRNLVLGLMRDRGMLTEEACAAAQAEALGLAYTPPKANAASWYRDAAREEAQRLLGLEDDAFSTSGLVITTGLDPGMQSALDALREDDALFPADASDGTSVECAVVCVEPGTGRVTAILGGREASGFDRARLAYRQPGSAIKPLLVFAPAAEFAGLSPATLLLDAPEDFEGYRPTSASGAYWGTVTARTALAHSLNLPAVRLLRDTGLERSLGFLEKLGIEAEPEDRHLALALGGFHRGVTPLAMAAAYAALSSGGVYAEPWFVAKIEDRQGRVLYEKKDASRRVMRADTAFLVTDMLVSAAHEGTAKRLASIPYVAAKTGTVAYGDAGVRDAWLCAVTPETSLTVWLGFDRTDDAHCLPSGEGGGAHAAVIAEAILKETGLGVTSPFSVPDSVFLVPLDKAALRADALELASPYTPEDEIWREWFADGTAPTTVCAFWDPPLPPTDLFAALAPGSVILSFTAAKEGVSYRLFREDALGTATLLAAFSGPAEARYTDGSAKPGETYGYFVVPVRLDTGLAGERSFARRVTVPRLPEITPKETPDPFWDRLLDFFRE